MPWTMIICHVPVCDRCLTVLRDDEEDFTPHFNAGKAADLDRWGWRELPDGRSVICPGCLTPLERSRYDQDGPDLFELFNEAAPTPPAR